ncbi:MAG: ECF transporter S component [Candidatus Bathyarchaeia archaeon]
MIEKRGNMKTWGLFRPFTSKEIAFIATMGAMGNALSMLSAYIGNFHPQIALDLSHVATFISALYLGPLYGFVTGCIASLFPFYRFGLTGLLGPVLGLMIIFEKGLAGLFAGILAKKVRPFFAVILGYVPECILMYITLVHLTALLYFMVPPNAAVIFAAIFLTIFSKAWFEIFVISFLMELFNLNQSFRQLLASIRSD